MSMMKVSSNERQMQRALVQMVRRRRRRRRRRKRKRGMRRMLLIGMYVSYTLLIDNEDQYEDISLLLS